MLISSKEFLDIPATIECRFTLKYVRDIIRTYSHDDITFKNALFGAVKLVKNADKDKYKCSEYAMGFICLMSNKSGFDKNVITF